MTNHQLRVAAAQVAAEGGQVSSNLKTLEEAVCRAAEHRADIVVFPELFLSGYFAGAEFRSCAEASNGWSFLRVSSLAREFGIAICYGYPEIDGDRLYNSALLVDDKGVPLCNHRKTQLYGDYEKQWFTAGDNPISTVSYRNFHLALLICYEIEFPETARANALSGANVILVPTATSEENNPDQVAQLMVRSRAAENNIFVVYANHAQGDETPKFNGRSIIVGPRGHVAAKSEVSAQELVVADLFADKIHEGHRINPYLDDIRLDFFASKLP